MSIRFDNWLLDANHVKFGLWEFVGKFKNVAEINFTWWWPALHSSCDQKWKSDAIYMYSTDSKLPKNALPKLQISTKEPLISFIRCVPARIVRFGIDFGQRAAGSIVWLVKEERVEDAPIEIQNAAEGRGTGMRFIPVATRQTWCSSPTISFLQLLRAHSGDNWVIDRLTVAANLSGLI